MKTHDNKRNYTYIELNTKACSVCAYIHYIFLRLVVPKKPQNTSQSSKIFIFL